MIPRTLRAFSCAFLFLHCACAGKQTGDEGTGRETDPTEVVEQSEPMETPEPVGPVPEPEPAPTQPVPGGELDSCRATTWPGPEAPRVEAGCLQQLTETGSHYVCSCDVTECPFYGDPIDDGDPTTPPEVELSDCLIESAQNNCADSLETICALRPGQETFCEREYSSLTPTHEGQVTPERATIVCFEQDDGTHLCDCPNADELVASEQTQCSLAVLTACAEPCQSELGNCTPNASGFDCNCDVGLSGPIETGLCDHALHYWCAPNCENDRGACYFDPSGGEDIACLCDGDTELRRLTRDPNVTGDECRTPLVEQCGGEP